MQNKSNNHTTDFLGLAAVVFFVVAASSVTTAVGTVASFSAAWPYFPWSEFNRYPTTAKRKTEMTITN